MVPCIAGNGVILIRSRLPAARTEFVRIADGVPAASERDSSSGSKEDERDLRVDHDSFE